MTGKFNSDAIDFVNKMSSMIYGKPVGVVKDIEAVTKMKPESDSALKLALDTLSLVSSGVQIVMQYMTSVPNPAKLSAAAGSVAANVGKIADKLARQETPTRKDWLDASASIAGLASNVAGILGPQGKAIGLALNLISIGLNSASLLCGNPPAEAGTPLEDKVGGARKNVLESISASPSGGFMIKGEDTSIIIRPSGKYSNMIMRLNSDLNPTEVNEVYTVQSGDKLGEIARRMKTTEAALRAANPQIKDPNMIYSGESIYVPRRLSDDGSHSPATKLIDLTDKPNLGPARQDATDRGNKNDQLSRNILHDDGFTVIASSVGPDMKEKTGVSTPADDVQAGLLDAPDSPLQQALAALGVKPREVQITPAEADDEYKKQASFDIRDNDTSEKVGSYAVTPTGCEMTAGDRKVVMDRISGNDIHLQTYAKNDDGEYELQGVTRIGDNDGVTVRRPFAA